MPCYKILERFGDKHRVAGYITVGGPTHEITDAKGKVWRFEFHHFLGPSVVDKKDNPTKRQPGMRSAFWPAFETWHAAHGKR